MVAGRDYHLRVEYHSHDRQITPETKNLIEPMENTFQGTRLGYEEFDESNLPQQAAEIAQTCDAALVVVGRDKEWETEGEDIPVFELPGKQVDLIEKVAAGQELGNAAADVICGDFNPSGRLPITFPRRLADCPAYSSFPGEQHQAYYAEGLYVGYRWWDLVGTEPLFPIGFGLSYCQFRLSGATVGPHSLSCSDRLMVTAQVDNIGTLGPCLLPGRETVIAWVSQTSACRLARPRKQICGFVKSRLLHAGESCHIEISIEPYALAMYDPQKGGWVIDQGTEFEILIGTTAMNAVAVGIVHVAEEIFYIHKLE
ncbi:hypothetical protein UA08_02059 [Talaromyces atroroseus]|uniref:beta-glucosidase n=1 Tax=Talaromyces atroroseus TaxID=1441469 RepID=A0A1Q5QC56_TALAT|nr:hypothetical protein UA08_02059 [Talaromyces atroroseus]OKL63514.1 hypothetical protein UA08_02059 [Talaromyces atroroseus]